MSIQFPNVTMPKTDTLQLRAASATSMIFRDAERENLGSIGEKLIEIWRKLQQQVELMNSSVSHPIQFYSIMRSVERDVFFHNNLQNVPEEERNRCFETNVTICNQLFQSFLKKISVYYEAVKLPGESLTLSMTHLNVMQERYAYFEDRALEKIWNQMLVNLSGFDQSQHVTDAKAIRNWLNDPKNSNLISNVSYLDLNGFDLKVIPREIGLFSQLDTLYLNNNQIRIIPDSISKLKKLRQLCLADNLINFIPDSIGALDNLLFLTLNNNRISVFSDSLFKLKNLRSLFLNANQLSDIPVSISKLENLSVLSLNNNKMSFIPDSISMLVKLNDLYLNKNNIEFIPDSVFDIPSLRGVWLNNNQIKEIPDSIRKCHQLLWLHLDNNKISLIPDSISSLKKIYEIYLNDNQISVIPDSISELKNLSVLCLNDNQISVIPISIAMLPKIKKIELKNNRIFVIPRSIGEPQRSLLKLDLFAQQPAPEALLSRLSTIQAMISSESGACESLTKHFEVNPNVLAFDLESILVKYARSNNITKLDQWDRLIDRAGLPQDDDKDSFLRACEGYSASSLGINPSKQQKVVNRLLEALQQYFLKKFDRLNVGSAAEQFVLSQFRQVFEGVIDANQNCVDQMLSQLESIVVDVLVREDLDQHEMTIQQRIITGVRLSLYNHRSALLKEILVKQNDDFAHMADLERVVVQCLANQIQFEGNVFQVGAQFENMVDSERVRIAIEAFWNEYDPVRYLIESLTTYHGSNQKIRNELLLWVRNNPIFSDDELVMKLSENGEEFPVTEGGNLTHAGLILLLEIMGIF